MPYVIKKNWKLRVIYQCINRHLLLIDMAHGDGAGIWPRTESGVIDRGTGILI